MQLKYFTDRIQISYLKKDGEQHPGKEGRMNSYVVIILWRQKANTEGNTNSLYSVME